VVEVGPRGELGHGGEPSPAEAPDLVFDAALLMGALDPGRGETRLESLVGAKRDEAILLDAALASDHARHRLLEVVEAQDCEDPPQNSRPSAIPSSSADWVCDG
jgi:hypothetical protein